MKKFIESYNMFIKKINEELDFKPIPIEYELKEYESSGTVKFFLNVLGNDIEVVFKKDKYTYERLYYINNSMNKIKHEKGGKILNAVSYITDEFFRLYSPNMLVVYHIADGKSGETNKRAKLNSFYLKNIAQKYGYKYELDNNHNEEWEENDMNDEISFIYKNEKHVDIYIKHNLTEKEDNINEELGDGNIDVDYTILNKNQDYIYKFEIPCNDGKIIDVKVSFKKFGNYYERYFTINGTIKYYDLSNIESQKILRNVTKLTEKFLEDYKISLLIIEHFADVKTSEYRMKLNRIRLKHLVEKLDYDYLIFYNKYENKYISAIYNNKSEIAFNDFKQDYYNYTQINK